MPDNAKPPRRLLLPPTVLLAAIVLSLVLGRWAPVADLWGISGHGIGIGIMVMALGVNIYCALQFRQRQTTILPFHKSTALITGGLYRFSRNPIYLSMAVLLCGLAIFTGAASPWVVPPLFMAVISKQFIEKEEAMLTEAFGEDYREYCRHVRRWL
jgi:protein-S-isoprenylcysteine O-methyltransferase Ste14